MLLSLLRLFTGRANYAPLNLPRDCSYSYQVHLVRPLVFSLRKSVHTPLLNGRRLERTSLLF
jgi:hypothetical protein